MLCGLFCQYMPLKLYQAPLQPLKDNLESQTYETFEKDPIKYQVSVIYGWGWIRCSDGSDSNMRRQ